MATIGDLMVRIGVTGLPEFNRAFGTASDSVNSFSKGLERTASDLQGLGLKMSAAITAPLVGIGAIATKEFRAFELAMRQVTSLMGKVSEGEFKKLSDQTLELSRRLGVDAVKAAQGLYEAISAGVPKENALTFMETASKTAIAGVTDTKVAVDGLTSIMNAYKVETSKANEVADAMFQSVNLGKFTFEQLAASISIATPLAAQLGVGFKELLAGAATLTKQGFSVSEAMTSIRSAMVALVSPNKQMKELFSEMGVASGDVLIKTKGLQGAFEALRTATHGNVETLTNALGRVEALGAVLGTTGQNAKGAREDIDALTNSAGAMGNAFDEINKSGARTWEQFQARLNAVTISAGQKLAPALSQILENLLPLVDKLAAAVEWFGKLDPVIQQTAIGLAAGAAALGPLAIGMGGILSTVSSLTGGIAGLAKVLGSVGQAGTAVEGLSGMASMALLAKPALIAVGAAIGGWALYKVVEDLMSFNEKLREAYEISSRPMKRPWDESSKDAQALAEAAKAGTIATDAQREAVGRLSGVVGSANAIVSGYGISLKKAGDEVKASVPHHQATAVAITNSGTAAAASAVHVSNFGKASREAGESVKVWAEITKQQQSALADLDKAHIKYLADLQQGKIGNEALARAIDESTSSMEELARQMQGALIGMDGLQGKARGLEEIYRDTAAGIAKLGEISAKEMENAAIKQGVATRTTDEHKRAIEKTTDSYKEFGRQVSTILTDFGKGIADSILHSKSLGEAFTKMAVSMKEAAIRYIAEEAMDAIKGAFKDMDIGIEDLGNALKKLIGKIGDAFKSIAGIFGSGSNAAGGAGGGVVGGVGAGAGGAASGAATGGILGAAGAIGSIVSAISSVWGNFQMRRMEQDIGRIEVTSREIKAELMNLRTDAWTREGHLMLKLDDIWSEIRIATERIVGVLTAVHDRMGQAAMVTAASMAMTVAPMKATAMRSLMSDADRPSLNASLEAQIFPEAQFRPISETGFGGSSLADRIRAFDEWQSGKGGSIGGVSFGGITDIGRSIWDSLTRPYVPPEMRAGAWDTGLPRAGSSGPNADGIGFLRSGVTFNLYVNGTVVDTQGLGRVVTSELDKYLTSRRV